MALDASEIGLIVVSINMIGTLAMLFLKAKHFRSSCCGHRVIDLKNSTSDLSISGPKYVCRDEPPEV